MAKILLDYFFKIIAVNPTPAASTAFLKQILFVGKPSGASTEGNVELCTSLSAAQALVASTIAKAELAEIFSGGLSRVYVCTSAELDIAEYIAPEIQNFFTILVSSDYSDADVTATAATGNVTITSYANLVSGTDDVVTINGTAFTAQTGAATLGTGTFQAATSNDITAASLAAQINAHEDLDGEVTASVVGAIVTITAVTTGIAGNAITLAYTDNDTNVGATVSGAVLTGGDGLSVGDFNGVIGVCSTDTDFCAAQAAIENRCAFKTKSGNGAKNMCYAFGKMLSFASDWKNQQYITMPFDDDVNLLGDAELLFDEKVSFVIDDDEFGSRLALFACGGKAIVAPYILRNLEIDLQSEGLQYVSANQPAYTFTQAALMEDEMQKVIDGDGQEGGNTGYVGRGWITEGTVRITLEEDNFVASGAINVPTPRALWRISGTITQS